MRSITHINAGDLDYSGLDTAERELVKNLQGDTGSSPIDLLPTEKVEKPRDLRELGFDSELAAEGIVSLSDLEDAYLKALETGSEFVGQVMSTEMFEELEKEDPELLVTVTEEIETPKALETAAEAAGYYVRWLKERNTAIEKRLERGTTSEGKTKIIRTWAAMRTLAKNEYIEKISELMGENEKERDSAITAIQFLSTAQLLTESDIIDKLTLEGATSKQVMSKPAKAAATGILVGTLMRAGDFDGKLLEQARNIMPNHLDYTEQAQKIESGVNAELYCIRMLAERLTSLEIPIDNLTISKTSKAEDMYGADIKIAGAVAGRMVAVFVDVKRGPQDVAGVIEDRGEGPCLYDGGGSAKLSMEAWQVPPQLLKLATTKDFLQRGVFKTSGGRSYDRVRAVSLRVKPRDDETTADPDFEEKTTNCLRWAFA